MTKTPTYSIVVPAYNEESVLPLFYEKIVEVFANQPEEYEVIFVDDGSSDKTYEILEELYKKNPRFKNVKLSRNFGHQLAVTAGLEHAAGQAIVIIDVDLQDPPEVILEMIKKWKEGYQIVYGTRSKRHDESIFKRITANAFYRLLDSWSDKAKIPRNVGDFRLIDRRVLEVFLALPERQRFLRGLFAWMGFKSCSVVYERAGRAAGESHYPLSRMIKFATDGLIGFSMAPLRLVLQLGVLISLISFLAVVVALGLHLLGIYAISGWAIVALSVFFMGGVQLCMIGVLGTYIGRIYEEVQHRPLYITDKTSGIQKDALEKISA